jgi:hypothetical protein
MIAGRFEVTLDEVDEFVEAVAMRTAARIAALLGHDPDGPRGANLHHSLPITGGEHEGWPLGQRNHPDEPEQS